jgi:deoxyribodipyrimidine photo-lyase
MCNQDTTGLIWFTKNLRVLDNYTLQRAAADNNRLIGVFFLDPRDYEPTPFGFKKTERFRAKFLLESVAQLRDSLKEMNISLWVVHGKPEATIPVLINDLDIQSIYLQKEWTREEADVLRGVQKRLPEHIKIKEIFDQFLFHPEDIPFSEMTIPKVFTDFRKACEKEALVRPEAAEINSFSESNLLHHAPELPTLEDLGFKSFEKDTRSAFPFAGGEKEAQKRLNYYFFQTKKLGYYKKTRNGLVGTDYSSKFSPWLANGSISARQVYWQVLDFEKQYLKNQSTYWLIFELIWRDYFKYISLKYRDKIFLQGGILEKEYLWRNNQNEFNSWIKGTTKEAFVNANMLELKHSGWMSNRGRQNVASYLAKELQIDWRWGAAYFEAMLLDYDVHSNYGNWMYVAGVGNDPRDRKFNVRLQSERYDPSGNYQNTWLQKTLFE